MAAPRAVSKAERAFVHDGIEQDLRADGRRREDFRPITLELGPLPQAAGSARVRLGGTEVLLAVRAEGELGGGDASGGAAREPRLEVVVELAASVAAARDERLAAEDAEADLGAALGAAYRAPSGVGGSALDWAALALGGGGAFALSLEALVLADDGGALDALALAAKAALAHATLPQLLATSGDGDSAEWAIGDGVLRLDVSAVPLIVTVSRLGRRCVLDASAAEEAHCGTAQWAAVTPKGDIAAAGSRRGGALPAGAAIDMLAAARKAGVALHAAMDECLRLELAAAGLKSAR